MKKNKIIIFGAFLGILALLIFLFLGRQSNYHISPVVAKNIQHPYIHNGEVYFYTGHSFAKYSVADQKTASLSGYMSYPKILNVTISKNGAVFKTNEVYPTDDLYYYLEKRGLPRDRVYWWLTDFKTGKTSLIGEKEKFSSGITAVAWGGNNLVAARQIAGLSHDLRFGLYKNMDDSFTLASPKIAEVVEEIIWASDDKAIFSSKKVGQGEARLHSIDFTSKTVTPLPEEVGGNVVASSDGGLLAFQVAGLGEIITEETLAEGLYLYRAGEDKPELVLKDFVGTITPSGSSAFLISGSTKEDGPVTATLGIEGKLKGFKVDVDEDDAPSLFSLSSLDQNLDQISATDESDNLYILSKDERQFNEPGPVPDTARDIKHPAYTISYFDSSDSFSILITKGPYRKSLSLALKDLQSKGVDLTQHNITSNPVRSLRVIR